MKNMPAASKQNINLSSSNIQWKFSHWGLSTLKQNNVDLDNAKQGLPVRWHRHSHYLAGNNAFSTIKQKFCYRVWHDSTTYPIWPSSVPVTMNFPSSCIGNSFTSPSHFTNVLLNAVCQKGTMVRALEISSANRKIQFCHLHFKFFILDKLGQARICAWCCKVTSFISSCINEAILPCSHFTMCNAAWN
jgi:hypothetical protein